MDNKEEIKSEVVQRPEVVEGRTLPKRENHLLQTSVLYSGPIPPPELFAGYEKALPGLADRVMKMSETQSAHRIDIESKVVGKDSFRETLGLIFAFIIVIIGLILGAYLIYKDKPVSGFVAMITPLSIIVGAFILQKKPSNKERQEPTEEEK